MQRLSFVALPRCAATPTARPVYGGGVKRIAVLVLVLAACGRKESDLAHAERVCLQAFEKRGYADITLQNGAPILNSRAAHMEYTAMKDGWEVDLSCLVNERKIRELAEDLETLPL